MKEFMDRIVLQEEEEEVQAREWNVKIEQLLLQKRRIFFSSQVNEATARDAIKKLWYLEEMGPGQPILFVINSPGGSVDSGFAVWDQIKMISSPVTTLVTGLAASMGSVLSLAAAPGRRFATPNSRIMVHQPLIHGVIEGPATDLEIQANEIVKNRKQLVALYAESTGKEEAVIEKTLDRDTWMSAQEAKDFGLLDGIVFSYRELGFV